MKVQLVLSSMFFLVALSACTPGGSDSGNQSPGKRIFLGELDKKMGEIYETDDGKYLTACDKAWKDRALEVSSFLEAHRSAIESFHAKYMEENKNENNNLVKLGAFTFQDTKFESGSTDTWEEYDFSWEGAYTRYQALKDTPVDYRWVRLNSYVRGMVPDEEERIVDEWNTALSKDAGPMITSIYNKVMACQLDENCVAPALTQEEVTFTTFGYEGVWVYALLKSEKNYSKEDRRKYVKYLFNRISSYYRKYEFRINELIKINGNILEMPMNLSVFGDDAKTFIKYIEDAWNNIADFSLRVVPTSSSAPNFLVSVESILGKRAFVDAKNKLMQLYAPDEVKVFAHEFGHVIGFRDTYYTTWSGSTCAYTQQSNAGDIMSDHITGKVLPRHWDVLKKQYWKQ